MRSGYTLVEMMVVLLIIALMTAAVLPVVGGLSQLEGLRAPLHELALYAKTARLESLRSHYPYEILLSSQLIRVQPKDGEDTAAAAGITNPYSDEVALPPDTTLQIQRFGDTRWRDVAQTERWTFQPAGVCEPLKIRLQHGETWIEHTYNPITARVEEEKVNAP